MVMEVEEEAETHAPPTAPNATAPLLAAPDSSASATEVERDASLPSLPALQCKLLPATPAPSFRAPKQIPLFTMAVSTQTTMTAMVPTRTATSFFAMNAPEAEWAARTDTL